MRPGFQSVALPFVALAGPCTRHVAPTVPWMLDFEKPRPVCKDWHCHWGTLQHFQAQVLQRFASYKCSTGLRFEPQVPSTWLSCIAVCLRVCRSPLHFSWGFKIEKFVTSGLTAT